jgi:hypothetical protein
MKKVLPIGCEYEKQMFISKNITSDEVIVFTYRIDDHIATNKYDYKVELINPIARRTRKILKIWIEGYDAIGHPITRAEFDGEEPNPTYEQQLELYGIEATPFTPVDYNFNS